MRIPVIDRPGYGLRSWFLSLRPFRQNWAKNVPTNLSARRWVTFVVAYDIAGMFYLNLFQSLRRPFEALIEGTIVYGVAAVGAWVLGMFLQARHIPIAPRRRRTDHLHQQP